MGVQRAKPSAGVRGAPEKLLFLLLRAAVGGVERPHDGVALAIEQNVQCVRQSVFRIFGKLLVRKNLADENRILAEIADRLADMEFEF